MGLGPRLASLSPLPSPLCGLERLLSFQADISLKPWTHRRFSTSLSFPVHIGRPAKRHRKVGWRPPTHKAKTTKVVTWAKCLWDRYVTRGYLLQCGACV